MHNQLEDCPFCGGEGSEIDYYPLGKLIRQYGCGNCNFWTSSRGLWNRRAIPKNDGSYVQIPVSVDHARQTVAVAAKYLQGKDLSIFLDDNRVRAWLVISKSGLVRGVWTTTPTAEQLAVALADGDQVIELVSKEEDFPSVPHTFGAFSTTFQAFNGHAPTGQQIFEAGMRSGREIWSKP